MQQDPHITFAHGGRADFRGCDRCLFTFLSTRDIAVNVRTEDASFGLRGQLVHGSFLTEVHVVHLHRPTSTWMNVSVWAAQAGDNNWGWRIVSGLCAGKPFAFGPFHSQRCADVLVRSNYSSVTIDLPQWCIVTRVRRVHGRLEGPHHRLDVEFTLTVAEADLRAWPHGVVGQSFDGDGRRRDGKRDHYAADRREAAAHPVIRTAAQAEGAIEGAADDYRVSAPYATAFRFSRFDVLGGAPRVSLPLGLSPASATKVLSARTTEPEQDAVETGAS